MPLYEYRCQKCGLEFEKLVVASKRDDVDCSACGSPKTDRQISTFAAKGSGSVSSTPVSPRFT